MMQKNIVIILLNLFLLSMQQQDQQQKKYLQKMIKTYSLRKDDNSLFLKANSQLQLSFFQHQPQKTKLIDSAIQSLHQAIKIKPSQLYYYYLSKSYYTKNDIQNTINYIKLGKDAIPSHDQVQKIYVNKMIKDMIQIDQIANKLQKQNNKIPEKTIKLFNSAIKSAESLFIKIGYENRDKKSKDSSNDVIKIILEYFLQMQQLAVFIDKNSDNQQKFIKIQGQLLSCVQSIKKCDTSILPKSSKKRTSLSSSQTTSDQTQNSILNLTKQISQLKLKCKQLEIKNQKIQIQIQEIKTQIFQLDYSNREQFLKFKNMFQKTNQEISLFNNKIQIIQGQFKTSQQNLTKSIQQTIIYIDQQLQDTIAPKNQIRKQFNDWKSNDKQLYQYANSLYWVLTNYMLSYRVASTGMIQIKQPSPSFFQEMFQKFLSVFTSVLKLVPAVAELAQIVEKIVGAIFQEYKERKFSLKVKKMNQILCRYKFQQDLSIDIGEGVISMCKMAQKKQQINIYKNFQVQNESFLQSVRSSFNTQVNNIILKDCNIQLQKQRRIQRLVIQDVSLLIGYFIQNQITSQKPISTSIDQIFVDKSVNFIEEFLNKRYLKSNNNKNNSSSTQNNVNQQCCLIF